MSLVLLLSKQLPATPKLSNGPYSSEYAFLYRDMDQIPKFILRMVVALLQSHHTTKCSQVLEAKSSPL